MGTGLVASVDRVRSVVVSVAYGSCRLTAAKGLGFDSEEEWFAWCRRDAGIVARSLFAFADIYDLIYGIGPHDGAAMSPHHGVGESNAFAPTDHSLLGL